MPRETVFTEPVVTTQFTPLQLRPRTMLGLTINGFARWLADHLEPFPSLIDKYRTAVVVRSLRIDYTGPDLRFGDSDWLTVRVRLRANDTWEWLDLRLEFEAAGRPAGSVQILIRVLNLAGDDSLGALPGTLPEPLRSRFTADESLPTSTFQRQTRPGRPLVTGVELLPPQEWRTALCRSHCEMADQWSFIEMVELATCARERLFAAQSSSEFVPEGLPEDTVRQAVRMPVRTLVASFRSPMFVFDPCRVVTRAHHEPGGDRLLFTHDIGRADGGATCLRVQELLGSH